MELMKTIRAWLAILFKSTAEIHEMDDNAFDYICGVTERAERDPAKAPTGDTVR